MITKKINWCGKELTIETGRIAKQADGAVLITYGETTVLCTVVVKKTPTENIDFVPLTVNYLEKAFAAGKIPGGFFKREGRVSDKETIISRLIDRTIRPLFPTNYTHETQVICTVLSHDGENDSDIISIVGTAAAIAISCVPIDETVGGIKVGMIDGEFIFNPTIPECATSDLDLSIGASKDSIFMVESGANELSEDQMVEALTLGQENLVPVLKVIEELRKEVGQPKLKVAESKISAEIKAKVESIVSKDLKSIYKDPSKHSRNEKLDELKRTLLAQFEPEQHLIANTLFKAAQQDIVQSRVLKEGIRIDGRDTKTIRPITPEVSVLSRTHGSAIFTRGETQAIVVTTLGSSIDAQTIDSISGNYSERFLLHYNFPPYSVGEIAPLRAPGRREIGHGRLAWRAIHPMLPSKEEFPYTIRIVAEMTGSNGSTSMATVCGSSLSLMDAGVPIKKPVAGIAMGLIKDGKKFSILSDILGDEDFLGHMDFKVAGTHDGITALQMDIKVKGITLEIMRLALTQAREGRLWILDKMAEAISTPRKSVNKYAPTITTITVPKDKIGAVIGSGGKTIKEICETTGAKIDIDETGVISIAAVNKEASDKAILMISNLVADVEVGEIYDGTVVKLLDFGAVVSFLGSKEGLLHISEISNTRVADIHDVLHDGDQIKVKVIGIEDRGRKIKLSMKFGNTPNPRNKAEDEDSESEELEGEEVDMEAPETELADTHMSDDADANTGDTDRPKRERRDRSERGDRGNDGRPARSGDERPARSGGRDRGGNDRGGYRDRNSERGGYRSGNDDRGGYRDRNRERGRDRDGYDNGNDDRGGYRGGNTGGERGGYRSNSGGGNRDRGGYRGGNSERSEGGYRSRPARDDAGQRGNFDAPQRSYDDFTGNSAPRGNRNDNRGPRGGRERRDFQRRPSAPRGDRDSGPSNKMKYFNL
jgi:polyribonucleotide nucleotidyltransferase